jgi:hypothetical protein
MGRRDIETAKQVMIAMQVADVIGEHARRVACGDPLRLIPPTMLDSFDGITDAKRRLERQLQDGEQFLDVAGPFGDVIPSVGLHGMVTATKLGAQPLFLAVTDRRVMITPMFYGRTHSVESLWWDELKSIVRVRNFRPLDRDDRSVLCTCRDLSTRRIDMPEERLQLLRELHARAREFRLQPATGPDARKAPAAPSASPKESTPGDADAATRVVPWATEAAVREVLDSVLDKVTDDRAWVVQEGDSATWYSYALPLRLYAEPARAWSDRDVLPIRAKTELLRRVQCDEDTALQVVTALNTHCSRSAVLWDPESKSISAACSAYLTDRTRDAAQGSIASAAVLESFEAHARTINLANLVHGVPSGADHPVLGGRPTPDDVFSMLEHELIPIGAHRSQFAGAEIRDLAVTDGVPWLKTEVTDTALLGSLAFSPSGQLGSAGEALSTILVAAEDSHPAYGNGALSVLQLPIQFERNEVPALANGLNIAEAREFTGFDCFGAWVPDPSEPTRLSFVTFWPSGFAMRGLLAVSVQNLALRNLWAAKRLTH